MIDCSLHPTINGGWSDGRRGLTHREAGELVESAGLDSAFAVGLPLADYEHQEFLARSIENSLVPIAAVTTRALDGVFHELEVIRNLGFGGVKIHPRMLGWNRTLRDLAPVICEAHRVGLVVHLCTYHSDRPGGMAEQDPLLAVHEALNREPEVRLVLVHGGWTAFERYAETARFAPSVLLDLSYTMTRLRGSPYWERLKWMAQTLDQRLCVGSDAPDESFPSFLEAAEALTTGLSEEKARNILCDNIRRLHGLVPPSR